MHLLDLPLETFRLILRETVWLLNCELPTQLLLVDKLFAREVIVAACATNHSCDVGYWRRSAFTPYYQQSNALAPGSASNYFSLTARNITNQMVEYLARDGNQRKKLSLAISRAAITFPTSGIRFCPRKTRILQMQTSQRSNAKEHLLSVAADLGNLALVKRLVKSVDVNTGSYVFGKPLLNAAWKGQAILLSK